MQIDGRHSKDCLYQDLSASPYIFASDREAFRATHTANRKTPPEIESLLRRYNKEGVTSWKTILERLSNEQPPIHIKRSTLGEYLKECDLGTSRRNRMEESEMRQLVLNQLGQPPSRKRGVRKVWECLKSNGHHIKRDFVEKVMKAVDPKGFIERRPKWKTLPGPTGEAGSALLQPTLPVPPPAPIYSLETSASSPLQRASHRSPSPPLKTYSKEDTCHPIQSRPSTLPFPHSPASKDVITYGFGLQVPPMAEISPNTFPVAGLQDARMEEMNEIGHVYTPLTTSDSLNTCGASGPPSSSCQLQPFISNNVAADGSSFFADGEAPVLITKINQKHGQETDSDKTSISDTDSETSRSMGESRKAELDASLHEQHCSQRPVEVISSSATAQGLNNALLHALSTGDETGQRSLVQRQQLQNTVDELLVRLDVWCSTPLQDAVSERIVTDQFPMSATRCTSGSWQHRENSREFWETQYIPNYMITEDQVTNDTLFLALTLQRSLSRVKSLESILLVADQLKEMRERLQDIGMLSKSLVEVGLRHLKVIEVLSQTSQTYRSTEWVLHDLWQCAASCVADMTWAGPVYDVQRRAAAEKAADAARQLIPIAKASNFYRAASLHYEAVCLLEDGEEEGGVEALRRSNIWGRTLAPILPRVQEREMLRIISAHFYATHSLGPFPDQAALFVLDQTLSNLHLPNDPAQANLLTQLAENAFCGVEGGQEPIHARIRERGLTLARHSVELLKFVRYARPSLFQPALVSALSSYADALHCMGRHQDATQSLEEAIAIQRQLAKFGGADAIRCLEELETYLESH